MERTDEDIIAMGVIKGGIVLIAIEILVYTILCSMFFLALL